MPRLPRAGDLLAMLRAASTPPDSAATMPTTSRNVRARLDRLRWRIRLLPCHPAFRSTLPGSSPRGQAGRWPADATDDAASATGVTGNMGSAFHAVRGSPPPAPRDETGGALA